MKLCGCFAHQTGLLYYPETFTKYRRPALFYSCYFGILFYFFCLLHVEWLPSLCGRVSWLTGFAIHFAKKLIQFLENTRNSNQPLEFYSTHKHINNEIGKIRVPCVGLVLLQDHGQQHHPQALSTRRKETHRFTLLIWWLILKQSRCAVIQDLTIHDLIYPGIYFDELEARYVWHCCDAELQRIYLSASSIQWFRRWFFFSFSNISYVW